MSHTLQCNFDLLITGGITRADKSFSAAAKCAAGNDSNPFLMQQTLAELLIGHSGNGDTRKSIKRAARLEALQAKLVEAADQQTPPPVVGCAHFLNILLPIGQRL